MIASTVAILEYTQLCLHVAMRAVALLLITIYVRNNNGKLQCHCRLVATEVIELAGCHFIGLPVVISRQGDAKLVFKKLQSVGVAAKKTRESHGFERSKLHIHQN